MFLHSGNLLVIGSTCSIVIGLTWGGVEFAWVSAHVLVPLCVGIVGIVAFLAYEWLYCLYPVVCPTCLYPRYLY